MGAMLRSIAIPDETDDEKYSTNYYTLACMSTS